MSSAGTPPSSEGEKGLAAQHEVEEKPASDGTDGASTEEQPAVTYIAGPRLHLIVLGLCLALFMAQMESSVTSTSILSITNDLGGFDKNAWIFEAYFFAYGGLLIIWAKFSDIFGRKPLLAAAVLIFVVFSGACGASQTLIQLIMFRWLQGIGGCGIYAIATLLFFELVPPSKFANYTALVTAVVSVAMSAGPLIGGVINDHGIWRWAFLINVPIGSVVLGVLVFTLPARLPNEPASRAGSSTEHSSFLWLMKKVDVLGALLLLGACLLIATGLQQAAQGASFSAPDVLPLLIFSGAMWAGFLTWQWLVTTKRTAPEPVFPWRFFKNRTIISMILNTYISGNILTVCIVEIPQRFMTVNGMSPFQAGVRLLPFGSFVPVGSVIAAAFMGKGKVPPFYILLAGGILEIIGTTFLSMAPTSTEVAASQYGFQILAGAGVGFFNAALILMVPFVVEKRDLAVGTGAVSQLRVLGGVLGLAIVSTVMNRTLKSQLLDVLPADLVATIFQRTGAVALLPEAKQETVRALFGEAYNTQMRILIGFAAAQIPATLLMWTKEPVRVNK